MNSSTQQFFSELYSTGLMLEQHLHTEIATEQVEDTRELIKVLEQTLAALIKLFHKYDQYSQRILHTLTPDEIGVIITLNEIFTDLAWKLQDLLSAYRAFEAARIKGAVN
jgi:hypothetical protein